MFQLVSVATEVCETEKYKLAQTITDDSVQNRISNKLKLKYKGIEYPWTRLLSYSFCYIGALTGICIAQNCYIGALTGNVCLKL